MCLVFKYNLFRMLKFATGRSEEKYVFRPVSLNNLISAFSSISIKGKNVVFNLFMKVENLKQKIGVLKKTLKHTQLFCTDYNVREILLKR
jgi:hypothetical protein